MAVSLLAPLCLMAGVAVAAPGASLEQKVGQLVMVGFRGQSLAGDAPILRAIRERHLGGVVLFDYDGPTHSHGRNIGSPQQLADLTATLQGAAEQPLLIAVDQEGGYASHLREQAGFPAFASQQWLGAQGDYRLTRRQGRQIGDTLQALGINLNFAPVVDLNINPDSPAIGAVKRSFSADPVEVTLQALALIQGEHEAGVQTTLKHFPGHGSAQADSHRGFVDVTDSWSEQELYPYRRLVSMGAADLVMTAHIFNGSLDPVHPATLSRAVVDGLLRREVGFDGVVISDDMQMGAIARYYGMEQAVELALNAGVDLLLFANNRPELGYDEALADKVIDTVLKLVRSGRVSEARIDEAFARLCQLKRRLGPVPLCDRAEGAATTL